MRRHRVGNHRGTEARRPTDYYSSLITVYRLPCGCARRSARRADGPLCCGLFFRIGTRESNLRGVCDPSFHFLVALIQPSASNSLMISNSFGSEMEAQITASSSSISGSKDDAERAWSGAERALTSRMP